MWATVNNCLIVPIKVIYVITLIILTIVIYKPLKFYQTFM